MSTDVSAAAGGEANAALNAGSLNPGPTERIVTLPTGDRVAVSASGGHTVYAMLPAAGGSGVFESYDTPSGDHYVIPAEAAPYVGRQLDRALFDVTRLLSGAADPAADRIPLTAAFAQGVKPAAPAGVTFTAVAGSTASGYFTTASAAAFGTALRQQIGEDVRSGRPAGSSGLFGGLARLSPADGPTSPTTAVPYFPMHFLQIDATGMDGAAADVMVNVVNTDSVTRMDTFVETVGGVSRIAVPAGHYAAYAMFLQFDDRGMPTTTRIVALNDFTVPDTPALTAIAIDERTATAPIRAHTPRPATRDGVAARLSRVDATGYIISTSAYTADPDSDIYVNAQTTPVHTGGFDFLAQWFGAGPTAQDPYRYDLAFDDDVIAADQTYTARPDALATVRHDIAGDPATSKNLPTYYKGVVPKYSENSFDAFGSLVPSVGPLTQYVGTETGGAWLQQIFWPGSSKWSGRLFSPDPIVYSHGRTYSREWGKGPLAPAFGQHNASVGQSYPCQACAGAGNLDLFFIPFGDSNPDTDGNTFVGTFHTTVFRDGKPIYDGAGLGNLFQQIPNAPSTYRAVLDTDVTAGGDSQSTHTHTDVTFHYSTQPDPASTLPSSIACPAGWGLADPRPCQVLPVLNLNYHLAATDDLNTAHLPIQILGLDVGHLSYGGQGSHSTVTSASVAVSFDSGTTWEDVPVIGTSGHYVALWKNPASATPISPALRVTAADAAGGSITQTIADAYTVAPR